MNYDLEEMEDGRIPRPPAPTPTHPRSQARAGLRPLRSASKGFRKPRLALPRAPQVEAQAAAQSPVLRTEHRVMDVLLLIALLSIALAITMKGDDR